MITSSKKLKSSWIDNDWILKQNSENEISEAIKEMLNEKFVPESKLNKKLKKYSSKLVNMLLNNLKFQDEHLDNINDKYRFASRMSWKGKISEKFLKNNWKKSSRNKM